MNITSKLLIKPLDKKVNFGFHSFLNPLLSHCIKLGFKSVESVQHPNLNKFVNLSFIIDESSIYQHVPMFSPFESNGLGEMEACSLFLWYTDLFHCKQADENCETFMIELKDTGRCKFTLFNLALAFIDQFEVIYIDGEHPNVHKTLSRLQIESYLNPVQVQAVA